MNGRATEAIVAGHICLDVIPALPGVHEPFRFRPGSVVEIGPVTLSTGGCVPNTGIALHRLGVGTRLLGRVADDDFGRIVSDLLGGVDPELARGLLVESGEHTSYTVVLSPPGEDRMFFHFPGANDTFANDDIPDSSLTGARIFHFGYPPIMRRMYEDGGRELVRVLERARAAGLTTGVDMAYPDPASPAGRADWRNILTAALPAVDVFLPSLEEMLFMLGSRTESVADVPAERISRLADELLEMGAGVVGIKAGDRGFYLRTASEGRLREAGPGMPDDRAGWADRELWSSVFEVDVAGTTGAGDATAAGFLLGLLRNMSPEEAVTAACAAGACSVEAADATSGVRSWEETKARIERGWRRRESRPGAEWRESGYQGIWLGPREG